MLIKIVPAVVLLVVTVIGFTYDSLLRDMDQAGKAYSQGDPEAALTRYEKIQQDLCIRGRPVYRAPAKNPSNSRAGNLLNHQKLNQGSRK